MTRSQDGSLAESLRLYLVTDSRWLDGRALEDCVSQAISGGATLVQLREKDLGTDEVASLASRMLPICKQADVPLIIDDDIAAAARSGADGVHVGQSDAACAEARALLGQDAIIGVSAQTVEQALEAQAAGADYLGVGAMFPTSTKLDADAVPIEVLRQICSAVDIPVVAIGGISQGNVSELEGTGIAGVAVVSAILAARDIRVAASSLAREVKWLLGDRGTRMRSVLSIAGSDCSGGAGIQADIKTIEANQLYATTAITAITVQNTCGVRAVEDISPEIVSGQIDAVFEDIRPDAVKIGMVSVIPTITAIAAALRKNSASRIVLDPVMVATSGSPLIADEAIGALKSELFPLSHIITPNIPEAELLSGMSIRCSDDMVQAARIIAEQASGNRCAGPYDKLAVLVKGGHGLAPGSCDDFLLDNDGQEIWICGSRVDNPNAHGTGCTLSSAIACGLAEGKATEEACRDAKDFITGALEYGLDLGRCSGPMNHMWQYMP